MNITLIGCGHGGQALAAHLTLLGHCITLYADERHPGSIHALDDRTLTLTGKLGGVVKIAALTTDIRLALREAEVIYLTLPTEAHLAQFQQMLPYLRPGQTVVTLAGNFSALYLHRALSHSEHAGKVRIADVASLPYACRADGKGTVNIIDIKRTIDIAAMPARDTDLVIATIAGHFPCALKPSRNLIEQGLNITSGISHPTLAIMNAGRIGPDEQAFYFYKEGISVNVSHIVAQVDHERMQIGERYGFGMPSYLQLMNDYYSSDFSSYYDFFTRSRVHNALKLCPTSPHDRYLSQDIPYVMLPWYDLGLHVGMQASTMQALIRLSSLLNDTCYFSHGRNVAQDFLTGMDPAQVDAFLQTGVAKRF